MIFAHSIIPHIHLQNDLSGSHHLVQKANPADYNWDRNLKFAPQPEDIDVCHISGLLFSQINHVNLFTDSDRVYDLAPVRLAGYPVTQKEQFFNSEKFSGTVLLRAPPAV